MQGRNPVRKFAANLSDYVWNVACGSRPGSRKRREWMEIDVVNSTSHKKS